MQLPNSFVAVLASLSLVALVHADSCPDGGSPATVNGNVVCCRGIITNDACLAGCSLSQPACFPFCSTNNDLQTVGTCKTVPFSASDYTSQVYSGGAAAAPTGGSATPGSSGGPTTTPASSGGSTSATGGSSPAAATGGSVGGSTGNTPTSTSTTGTSTSKAGAAITEAPVFALAGALALAALI